MFNLNSINKSIYKFCTIKCVLDLYGKFEIRGTENKLQAKWKYGALSLLGKTRPPYIIIFQCVGFITEPEEFFSLCSWEDQFP